MRFVYDENGSDCIWRADYYLTTIAKTSEALPCKASEVFLQNGKNMCNTNQTLAPQAFRLDGLITPTTIAYPTELNGAVSKCKS